MSVSKIIELTEPVHVLGKTEFRVLEGSVFINGKFIDAVKNVDSSFLRLYSPRSTALIEIEPIGPGAKVEFKELSDGLEGIQTCQPNFGNIFEPENEMIESFELVIKGLYFLKDKNNTNVPVMRITEEWRQVLTDLRTSPCPIIFVCGHRKVGKSSFSRFVLNGLLNNAEEIDFIDLDPGQTEFTPAGFISRMRFNKHDALLGPPFTHLQIPDDSIYLASSNGSDAPFLYTRAVETLKRNINVNNKNHTVPVIINTMGWMTGLGLELIQYALQVFKPSHVLAFMAPEGEDTIRKCLTTNSFGLSGALTPEEAENIYVRYMGNPTNDSPRGKHSPADQRNFAYWAYFFGQIQEEQKQFISFNFNRHLSEMRPMVVPLSYVQLASTCREIDLFELLGTRSRSEQMNLLESWLLMRLVGFARDEKFRNTPGRWVNLLSSSKVKRVAEMPCIGLGLLRSIVRCSDDRIHLHLLTPLPLSHLSTTNTLILGNLQMPIPIISADTMSMKAEAPGFSTQMVGTEVAGAGARKTRHNMRRK